MNTETDKFNIYENDMKFAKRNVPNERNNKNVTMREYSRFMASLICQSNQIENDFKEILKQNKISSEELKKIQSSCELYNKMSVLINDWNNFLLHWQMNEHSWSAKIDNENQKRNSSPII